MSVNIAKNSMGKFILSVLGLLLLVAVILFFYYRPDSTEEGAYLFSQGEALPGAQAQSYTSEGAPFLKDNDKVLGLAAVSDEAVKIFVFEDYSSSFSAVLADDLEKVRLEFGDAVAIIVRPFTENGDASAQATLVVECAAEQNKWREMRALLFARLKSRQLFEVDAPEYVSQLGLKSQEFTDCLTQARKSGTIEQAVLEARQYQVYGAPTLFIGDEMIPGARPFDDYIDSEGQPVAGLKTIIAKKLGVVMEEEGEALGGDTE